MMAEFAKVRRGGKELQVRVEVSENKRTMWPTRVYLSRPCGWVTLDHW